MTQPMPTIASSNSEPSTAGTLADAVVVARVLAGDSEAYAVLVRRHQEAQFRTALRLTGNGDDAHDALQSAFVRAHRHLRACDDPARFGAWLARIVVNECRTLVTRRAHRERKLVRDEATLQQLQATTAGAGDVHVPDDIARALAQLPYEQREAFVLKYVDDLSYEEIADRTGLGVSALKMRVKRACERLRTLLDGAS